MFDSHWKAGEREGGQQMKWKVRGFPKQGDLDNFKGGWEGVSVRM